MAIYVEKTPLANQPMQDDVPMMRGRDAAAAMALVVSKHSPMTPRTQPHVWNAHVDPKASSVRRVEHVPVVDDARWTPFQGTMKSGHCRSMPFSRKRRLAEVVQRPTKYLRLSKQEPARSAVKVHVRVDAESTQQVAQDTQLSRPRTLHFALPGLSSRETLQLLGELVAVRHELAWLNTTRPIHSAIIPVFGWRSVVWSVPTPKGNDAVVYKSAKAFEGVGMHSIAREMWMWQGSQVFPELSAPRLVYAISNELRIVQQQDCLHGRAPHSSLWLEYVDVQEESIVLVRKELHRFQDITTGPTTFSDRECHGYILHPLLVPMGSQVVAGTALHTIGSLRTRDLSACQQIERMVADLPRHVLQWEDSFVLAPSRV